MEKKKKFPETFAEAVDEVIRVLPQESLDELKKLQRGELFCTHFGIGMWIRNELGLWGENTKLLESEEFQFIHTDSMSTKLVEAVWEKLNGDEG